MHLVDPVTKKLPCSQRTGDQRKELFLRGRVDTVLQRLNDRWCWWAADRAHLVEEVACESTTDQPQFLTLLKYQDLWTAFTLCIYDATRILLLQLWHLAQDSLGSPEAIDENVSLEVPERTAPLGITSDHRSLGREILRTLQYCYEQSPRFVYTFSFWFIQDVAYGCLEPDSKEAVWAATHGWARSGRSVHVEDTNVLRLLTPSGQIRCHLSDHAR